MIEDCNKTLEITEDITQTIEKPPRKRNSSASPLHKKSTKSVKMAGIGEEGQSTLQYDNLVRSIYRYKWFGLDRKSVHRKTPKGSGCVGVLIRDNILTEYDVTIIDECFEGILGMSLKHKSSEYSLNLFCCYLAPENSHWGRNAIGFYAHLLNQIYLDNDVDDCIICGDLSSRVGDLLDYILDVDEINARKTVDKVVNHHGQSLIEFLLESKYVMLNGRINEENIAATCVTARGSSMVDYVLVPKTSLSHCTDFKIKSALDIINEFDLHRLINSRSKPPDHAVITFKLTVSCVPCVVEREPYQVDNRANVTIRRYNFKNMHPDFGNSEI